MQRILTRLLPAIVCLAFTSTLGAIAADKKADPAGTWTWSTPGRNGGEPRKSTLKLKVDGDKVTGTLSNPGRQGGDPVETKIEDGKISGEDVSFTITREFNGNKMTAKYNAKLSGDTLKGKIETDRNGTPQSRDWEAKREAKKE
jgi:hypothetical protein